MYGDVWLHECHEMSIKEYCILSSLLSETAKIWCEQKTADLAEFTIQSRLGRMEKISYLWSDFKEIIKKKISSAHKMKEHVTENLDVHWDTGGKTHEKTIAKIYKIVHDSITFGRRAYFCFEKNNSNNFRRKFSEAEKSRLSFGRQQNFSLRSADFPGVCILRPVYGIHVCLYEYHKLATIWSDVWFVCF